MIYVLLISILSLLFALPIDAQAYVDPNMGGFFLHSVAPFIYILLGIILIIISWWKIFKKAGYAGPWGLIMVIPLINIIAMLIFAFSNWPISKEIDQLKHKRT